MAAQPRKQFYAGPNYSKVADRMHTMAAQPGKHFSVGPGVLVNHISTTMAAQPRKYFSVGPSGATVLGKRHFPVGSDGEVDLIFASEPLGMPAEQGYGWAQWKFKEKVGPDARYTIVRKLGWGSHSSAWLAHDAVDKTYVVIKALTGYITRLHQESKLYEMRALTLLSSPQPSPHCLHSLAIFTVPGTGSSGDHLCIVTPVYGGDVKALLYANGIFPVPLAKRILLHLLRGLAFAHERGIIHTDLKMDNIFFTTPVSNNDIDQIVKEDLPRLHKPEMSHDGIVSAAVSQPLPLISIDEAMKSTFLLADFGSAQPARVHDDRMITTPPLRPPEVFLDGGWDKSADIWSFGCLVYELTMARSLFRYETDERLGLTREENMLHQMMTLTGDKFKAVQLNISALAAEYFTPNCTLKKQPPNLDIPFETCLSVFDHVDPEEIPIMANFMRRCLRLDPEKRARAEDLLNDPWLQGVD